MKKLVLLLLVIICIGLKAEKFALVVAIGDYPDPGKNGWAKISSGNDAPLVTTALESQGFKKENITLLQDAAATKQGIQNAFDQLISKVKAGDIVVIHFSSHGEQIEDDNSDEVDFLDECIVPYGAVYTYDKNRFKEFAPGYLRDDEFGQKVTLLRNKLTGKGDLLVLLDACHSGTGTRGAGELKCRGAMEPMVSHDFDSKPVVPDNNGVFKDNNGATLSKDASTYVVISGAQAKEFNYECYDDNGNPVGSLSYAFSKSISELKNKESYRGLFASIENIMRDKAPRQKPVMEGDGLDRTLFGGDFITQKPYFTIKKWLSTTELIVNAGSVTGLSRGSVVNIFPSSTNDPAGKTPFNKGTVTALDNFTATLTLEKPDTTFNMGYWLFLTELQYGDKVKLDVLNINGTTRKIQEALRDFPLVEFTSACDIYLDTFGSVNKWALKYPTSGEVFKEIPSIDGAQNIEMFLKQALKTFARFRYLQGLDFNEEGLEAKVNLVFLKPDGSLDNEKIKSRTHNGRLELKDNDVVYLQIINTGYKAFYLNIVDIQPDGKINPILPNKKEGIRPEDCEFAKYDSAVLSTYKITIGAPYGQETFKVFLSRDPLDLEDILVSGDDKASRSRGVLNNMAKVFVDSQVNETGTRGGTGKVDTDQNGTINNINFMIVPK